MGERVGARGQSWSEKIFWDKRGVVEWDGFNFKTNKFLNGLWDGIFEGSAEEGKNGGTGWSKGMIVM